MKGKEEVKKDSSDLNLTDEWEEEWKCAQLEGGYSLPKIIFSELLI